MKKYLIILLLLSTTISIAENNSSLGLLIPKGDSIELPSSFFTNPIEQINRNISSNSKVWMTYFNGGLKFTFECKEENNKGQKNSNTEQEIFQITLSQANFSVNSFEFKLNPENEISVFKKDITGIYKHLNAQTEGIRYNVYKIDNGSWKGWIFIPFKLIGKSKKYKLSFVRIIKLS